MAHQCGTVSRCVPTFCLRTTLARSRYWFIAPPMAYTMPAWSIRPASAQCSVATRLSFRMFAVATGRTKSSGRTNLWVRVLDVAPDGTALNLMSPGLDAQRASNREHARAPQWLTPKKIYLLDLNNLITSNSFLASHRIRAQISASFFPNFSRNLQNGKSEVTSANMQKSAIAAYSDSTHASQLILPVVTAP